MGSDRSSPARGGRATPELQRKNMPLYRAYILKETLLEIRDRRQVHVARERLEEWMAWTARSQLELPLATWGAASR